MQKFNKMIVLAVILIFLAGVIIGQGFSLEVKLSDLIATAVALITFLFAWIGLKHNERQYLNSIKPLLYIHKYEDHEDKTVKRIIKNCGTGPAVETSYKLYYAKVSMSSVSFNNIVCKTCPGAEVQVSTPEGYAPSESLIFLEINLPKESSKLEFQQLREMMKKVEIEITYFSVQQDKFVVNSIRK
ncbi:hypothetical protein L1264_15020 [Pseudoalteromonas sp. APAL1]|jgi:hypothetical protein|uniref:hypothetical protein n=1 Tax=Pseudoalteromonas TaxID=53246 RepID=UPI000ECFF6D9|nr:MULTISPECIES: hypothetical protein [unclassified Pseudoalteromonas]MCF2921790.1 hypothetical protein [Pseudoalteromonas sp. APAL1]HCV01149.1 hypothetical protein [Pseudoalteromonas sp.]|tara:strand:+ start:3683 stop:4240 length:558 start_codon:yes stop_codon:yes gene_type:complete